MLLASTPLAAAVPDGSRSWLIYEERLLARLRDEGGGSFDPAFARDLLVELNRFRADRGLRPVQWDEGLATSARAHAADMLAEGYFEHHSPEGFTHLDRVGILNRDFCGQAAENLAFRDGGADLTRPQRIQAMWEASPGHLANLRNPEFGDAGFGVVQRGNRVIAVGLYGDVAVRLGQQLPFRLRTQQDLAAAITNATPSIDRLSVTAPGSRASWMIPPGQALPDLDPGIWQLRPLRAVGASNYQVLRGPLFQLAA